MGGAGKSEIVPLMAIQAGLRPLDSLRGLCFGCIGHSMGTDTHDGCTESYVEDKHGDSCHSHNHQ